MRGVLIPLVLCGGAGTRLWPVSREVSPKPFMTMPDGETLIEKTYRRVLELKGVTEVITMVSRDHCFRCRDEFERLCRGSFDVTPTFFLENQGRGTASAVAVSALYVRQKYGDDAILLVMPSDHLIKNVEGLLQDIGDAISWAERGWLMTFGVPATTPETGFGYMSLGEALGPEAFKVDGFFEKPDLATAQKYADDGNYFWNSGIFCFQTGVFLGELGKASPEVVITATECWRVTSSSIGTDRQMVELKSFNAMPNLSLDYALMEKSKQVAAVISHFDWSDVGTWTAISALIQSDENGNQLCGDVVVQDVTNSFVRSEYRLVGVVGIDNCIVVETSDAVLVTSRTSVQGVRDLVMKLNDHPRKAISTHETVRRPWGSYTVLQEGKRFKIKRIEVNPGASLSLQKHKYRAEHWVVVDGVAKVVNGDEEFLLESNQSTYIAAGCVHRLVNPGPADLVIIEIQSGDYVGEDDIIRLDDIYGRL